MRNQHEDSFSPADADPSDAPAFAASSTADSQCRKIEAPAHKPAVVKEVLIEEVTIDGMCGVY